MSFKSPLNQVIGLGSAKQGASHWWHQRLTAVAMIPLGLWFAVSLPGLELNSHAALVAWIQEPMTSILLVLTVACLAYHSWLGIAVVIEDYVAGGAVKLAALVLSSLAHVFLLAVCLFAILSVAFGVST